MTSMIATVERPRASTADRDVLVVAAGKIAFEDYRRYNAYMCQPKRSFRDVERMGFYRDGRIEPQFPRIRYRKMNVEFSRANEAALRGTGSALDAEVADLIDGTLDVPGGARHEG